MEISNEMTPFSDNEDNRGCNTRKQSDNQTTIADLIDDRQ